jgi:hypothetical protein
MKKSFHGLAVTGLVAASLFELACGNRGDAGTGATGKNKEIIATAAAAEHGDDDRGRRSSGSADSSPYVVGAWKFSLPDKTKPPTIDTEFRFINPTREMLTLEYAFFENDGTFCGCDRDDFPPNKTTEYSMLDESKLDPPLAGGPRVFSCLGTSGSLKSIVFKHHDQRIRLDDGMQVGFQTHAFGNISEGPTSAFLTGTVMAEAPLQGVALNESTREDIRAIHEACVTVNGPL